MSPAGTLQIPLLGPIPLHSLNIGMKGGYEFFNINTSTLNVSLQTCHFIKLIPTVFNLWVPAAFSMFCAGKQGNIEQLDFSDAKSLHQTGHLNLHQLCLTSKDLMIIH